MISLANQIPTDHMNTSLHVDACVYNSDITLSISIHIFVVVFVSGPSLGVLQNAS